MKYLVLLQRVDISEKKLELEADSDEEIKKLIRDMAKDSDPDGWCLKHSDYRSKCMNMSVAPVSINLDFWAMPGDPYKIY